MPVQSCPFCEVPIAIEFARENGHDVQVEAHQLRPFRVEQAQFETVLLEWLAAGDYTPDDILSSVLVSRYTGVFVPFFRFRGEYRANFSASAGYSRVETYTATETDLDGNRELVERTRTVTDWRPMNGEASDDFQIFCCASKTLPAKYHAWCEEQVCDQLGGWTTLNENDIEKYALEPFSRAADEVFTARGKPKLRERVVARCMSGVPGDKTRDLKFSYRVRDRKAHHVYQPLWIASLQFGGEQFHFIQSGSAPDAWTGQRPEDKERKRTLKALMKPPTYSAVAWVLVGLLGFPLGAIPTIIAVVIGGPMSLILYLRAKKQQKAILSRSREVRQRLLGRVKTRGGLRRDGALGVSASDVATIEAQLDAEAAEEERRVATEKAVARKVTLDHRRACGACGQPTETGWAFCRSCGAQQHR